MSIAITPVSRAEQALARASTPQETREVEAMAAAGKAWAKEQNDYELTFKAALIYILARCKTTELIMPTIKHGGDRGGNQHGEWQGNGTETLADYGFNKQQWNRRKKELNAVKRFDSYQDDCVEKRVIPTPFGLVGFASGIHVSEDSYEWYTPKPYVEAVRKVMGSIDLDPASCDEAQKNVKAKEYYTEEDDGLAQSWSGCVFLNPPYNMPVVQQFVDRTIQEYEEGKITSAVVLVNNATDAGWFHRLLAYPVCLTQGRVKFTKPGGEAGGPRQGQAFFYLGEDVDKFYEVFSNFGVVLTRYDDRE
jgi:phage N-6-adenine-methyltransferase